MMVPDFLAFSPTHEYSILSEVIYFFRKTNFELMLVSGAINTLNDHLYVSRLVEYKSILV